MFNTGWIGLYQLDWIIKKFGAFFLGAYGVLKIRVTHEEWLNEIPG